MCGLACVYGCGGQSLMLAAFLSHSPLSLFEAGSFPEPKPSGQPSNAPALYPVFSDL